MGRLEVEEPLHLDTSHVLMYQIPRRVSGRDGEIYLGEISRASPFYLLLLLTSSTQSQVLTEIKFVSYLD